MLAHPVPANSLTFGLLFRVQQRQLAQFVQTGHLHQVGNGEAITHMCPGVSDLEVKPLSVLLGIEVSPQVEFIVKFTSERE